MGIILAKFRKKITTYDQLEKLDTQIKNIEEYGKTTELTQRKVAGRFLLASVFVYVVTAIIFYFYFFPVNFYERLLYVIPLITAPLVIISVKRVLTWWYNRKLKKNRDKLSTLKEQKKKMLDKVMDTETYKVAKKILEKFAPDEVITRKSQNTNYSTSIADSSLSLTNSGPVGLRYRGLQPSSRASLGSVLDGPSNPALPFSPIRPANSNNMALSVGRNLALTTPRIPMVRTILPRERSAFDKLVDYLVGDGPSNRYALICKQCSSHNGMALREEFEYISFHCCYCHTFNPAKKQRPPAPKLGTSRLTPPRALKDADTSESERNSDTDSDTLAQKSQLINSDVTPPDTTANEPETLISSSDNLISPTSSELMDVSETKDIADTSEKISSTKEDQDTDERD